LVDVRLPGPQGAVVTATLPRQVNDGESLQMFVRPSAVHIVAPSDAQFMARVRDVAFAGRGYEHALATEGPILFTRIFSDQRWERGSAVGMRLSPDGCLVLPADDHHAAADGADRANLVDLTAGDGAQAAPRRAS